MKFKEENDYLKGRVRDLWRKAAGEEYAAFSRFLSLPEQAAAAEVLREEGAPLRPGRGKDGPFWLLLGGTPEDDRRILLCCPSWTPDPVSAEEYIACLSVTPKNARFTDHPGHRDYLGALMSLGITREQIGDIYTEEEGAWIFCMREMAETICRELTSVRHTAVRCAEVPLGECAASKRTKDITGSIASERIDCIIAMAMHLSREKAQSLVESELVFCDGRIPSGPSYRPAEGERISVRGYGKFQYLGTAGKTRKGRLSASVRMFL